MKNNTVFKIAISTPESESNGVYVKLSESTEGASKHIP